MTYPNRASIHVYVSRTNGAPQMGTGFSRKSHGDSVGRRDERIEGCLSMDFATGGFLMHAVRVDRVNDENAGTQQTE